MDKIIVCDDDTLYLERIVEKIESSYKKEKIEIQLIKYTSGKSLLEDYKNNHIESNICFLDIELDDINGIEIAKQLIKINSKLEIVFVSNHDDLVFQAIHVRPIRFVRKSRFDEELTEAVEYLITENKNKNKLFSFMNGNKQYVQIYLKYIIYIENNGHYINICSRLDNYKVRGKVSDYVKELEIEGFVQIQKGIVVNLSEIEKFKAGKIYMNTGVVFNVSRDRNENVEKKLMEFLRNKVK